MTVGECTKPVQFLLALSFPEHRKELDTVQSFKRRKSGAKTPTETPARRADPSTGKRPANTCADRRRQRPRAGRPSSMIRGRIRSAPKPSHPSSSASCNRKQPTAPWYPERRAAWNARCARTGRRAPNAPGPGMNPTERPAQHTLVTAADREGRPRTDPTGDVMPIPPSPTRRTERGHGRRPSRKKRR